MRHYLIILVLAVILGFSLFIIGITGTIVQHVDNMGDLIRTLEPTARHIIAEQTITQTLTLEWGTILSYNPLTGGLEITATNTETDGIKIMNIPFGTIIEIYKPDNPYKPIKTIKAYPPSKTTSITLTDLPPERYTIKTTSPSPKHILISYNNIMVKPLDTQQTSTTIPITIKTQTTLTPGTTIKFNPIQIQDNPTILEATIEQPYIVLTQTNIPPKNIILAPHLYKWVNTNPNNNVITTNIEASPNYGYFQSVGIVTSLKIQSNQNTVIHYDNSLYIEKSGDYNIIIKKQYKPSATSSYTWYETTGTNMLDDEAWQNIAYYGKIQYAGNGMDYFWDIVYSYNTDKSATLYTYAYTYQLNTYHEYVYSKENRFVIVYYYKFGGPFTSEKLKEFYETKKPEAISFPIMLLDPTFYNGTHYFDLVSNSASGFTIGDFKRVEDNEKWLWVISQKSWYYDYLSSSYTTFDSGDNLLHIRFVPNGTMVKITDRETGETWSYMLYGETNNAGLIEDYKIYPPTNNNVDVTAFIPRSITIAPHTHRWFFNGGYITVNDGTQDLDDFPLTLSFEATPTMETYSWKYLFGKNNYGSAEYVVQINSGHYPDAPDMYYNNGTNTLLLASGNTKIELNKNYRITAVFDYPFKLYMNNNLDKTIDPEYQYNSVSGSQVSIGGRYPDGAGLFKGYISYTMIHAKPLEEEDVEKIENHIISGERLALFLDPSFYDGKKYDDLTGKHTEIQVHDTVKRIPDPNKWLWIIYNEPDNDGKLHIRYAPRGSILELYDVNNNLITSYKIEGEPTENNLIKDFTIPIPEDLYKIRLILLKQNQEILESQGKQKITSENLSTKLTTIEQPYIVLTQTNIPSKNIILAPHLYKWSFDGVDDYIKIDDNPSFTFNNELTIITLFKVGEEYPFSVNARNLVSRENNEFRLRLISNGKYWFLVNNGTSVHTYTFGTIANNGVWEQGSIVFHNGETKLFVNGEYKETHVFDETMIADSDTPIYIGSYATNHELWLGEIAYTILYKRSLTASEIQDTYNNHIINGEKIALFLSPTAFNGIHYIDLTGNAVGEPYGGVLRVPSEEKWLWVIENITTDNYIHIRWIPNGTIVKITDTVTGQEWEYLITGTPNGAGLIEDYTILPPTTNPVNITAFIPRSITIAPHLFTWYVDGVNSTIRVNNDPHLNVRETTIYTSYYPLYDEGFARIFAKSHIGWDGVYQLNYEGGNNLRFLTNNGTAVQYIVADVGDLKEWKNIVAVYDPFKIKIYKNDLLLGENSVQGFINSNTEPLWIGSNGGSDTQTNGFIRFLQIYNTSIVEKEITNLLNNKINGLFLSFFMDPTFYNGTHYKDIVSGLNGEVMGNIIQVPDENKWLWSVDNYVSGDGRLHFRFMPVGTRIVLTDTVTGDKWTYTVSGSPNGAGLIEDYTILPPTTNPINITTYIPYKITVAPHLYDWLFEKTSDGYIYYSLKNPLHLTSFTTTIGLVNVNSGRTLFFYGSPSDRLRINFDTNYVPTPIQFYGTLNGITGGGGFASYNRYGIVDDLIIIRDLKGKWQCYDNTSFTSERNGAWPKYEPVFEYFSIAPYIWGVEGVKGKISYIMIHNNRTSLYYPLLLKEKQIEKEPYTILDPTFYNGTRYLDLYGKTEGGEPYYVSRVPAEQKWLWTVKTIDQEHSIHLKWIPYASIINIYDVNGTLIKSIEATTNDTINVDNIKWIPFMNIEIPEGSVPEKITIELTIGNTVYLKDFPLDTIIKLYSGGGALVSQTIIKTDENTHYLELPTNTSFTGTLEVTFTAHKPPYFVIDSDGTSGFIYWSGSEINGRFTKNDGQQHITVDTPELRITIYEEKGINMRALAETLMKTYSWVTPLILVLTLVAVFVFTRKR